MKLHDILKRTRGKSKIAVIHYLSGEVFINDIKVSDVIENAAYFENYRQREVYAVEIENNVMNIEII